jgi:hypothetical protein
MADLKLRLEDHAEQTGIPRNWWQQYNDSIHIDKCPTGGCLRDRQLPRPEGRSLG